MSLDAGPPSRAPGGGLSAAGRPGVRVHGRAQVAKCGELFGAECHADFFDLNCGCVRCSASRPTALPSSRQFLDPGSRQFLNPQLYLKLYIWLLARVVRAGGHFCGHAWANA